LLTRGPIESLINRQRVVGLLTAIAHFNAVRAIAATSTERIVVAALLELSILTVHHESPNIGALTQEGTTWRA